MRRFPRNDSKETGLASYLLTEVARQVLLFVESSYDYSWLLVGHGLHDEAVSLHGGSNHWIDMFYGVPDDWLRR